MNADTAFRLGRQAFYAGAPRVALADERLMGALSFGAVGSSVTALHAWINGWDTANLEDCNTQKEG